MPWPIFSISSISDLESFRKAIFYYQKIRRKILRRLHYELTARPYAPPSFVGEQRNVQNLCNNRILEIDSTYEGTISDDTRRLSSYFVHKEVSVRLPKV
jgi:hypothetical protein